MPGDPLRGLFKRRLVIDLPGGERERAARQLAARGLLSLEEAQYVRCVNPLDPDQRYLKDKTCTGKTYLSTALHEDDHEYHCPDCGRVLFPSKKRLTSAIRLTPDLGRIRTFLLDQMKPLGLETTEHPNGLFRMPLENGELQVCYVDACYDSAVFDEKYARRDSLVFVVGNDRDFLRRLPKGAKHFRLADLALGDDAGRFQRTLRQMARIEAESPVPVGPAVLGLGPPAPQAPVALPGRAERDAGAAPMQVPAGTRWNQIDIFHGGDEETVVVRAPGHPTRRCTHFDLGMASKKSRKRTKKWEILVDLCAEAGTIDDWRSLRFGSFSALTTQLSELRKALQDFFGLGGDPVPTCSREDGLRAAFHAHPDPPGEKPMHIGEEGW